MKLLEKILVPIDLDNQSNIKHIETAISLAKRFNSKVLLQHVLPQEAKLNSINSLILKYVDEELDNILKQVTEAGVNAEKIISYGNPFEQILSIAESEDVNLIITYKSPQNNDNPSNMDIISEKLLRKSIKPVWFVKRGNEDIPNTIMCPVDFSGASERALQNAIKIARTFQCKLHVINVFEPLQENFSPRYNINYDDENNKLENANTLELDAFLEKFNFTDVDFEINILKGKPNKEIIEFAKNNEIDLIFIGATGKSYLQRILLGSITEMVIKALPCSIVITKEENILDLKIDKDISVLEKHLHQAEKLEEAGYYHEAINQLKICLQLNDLHLPTLNKLSKIYNKLGEKELAENYKLKSIDVLNRLWDKKIELDLRKGLKI